MSGVIGAVSNKFILIAATLMLQVTVNRDRVHGAIDPALKVSVISPELAARYHLGDGVTAPGPVGVDHRRRLNIGIGAEDFDIDTVAIARDPCCFDRDLVIGQDILAGHVFDVDFARRTIRLVLPFEYRHATKHLQSIALSRSADGTLLLPIQIGAAAPVDAVLDLADPGALKIDQAVLSADPSLGAAMHQPVRSGGAMIGNFDISVVNEQRRAAHAVLGLAAFAGSRVILDLPHGRIWVPSRP